MNLEEKTYDYSCMSTSAEVKFVREEFKKVFDYYELKNYPDDDESLMCSIHTSFEEKGGHCCVGCNMEESSRQIINFIKKYPTFSTAQETFPIFIFLLYLMVERIEEYLKIMELQKSIKEKSFKVFSLIKQWANFIKHPKGFMLVHHPAHIYNGFMPTEEMLGYKNFNDYDLKIDSEFVKEFYSNNEHNKKLYDKLMKKDSVIVIFPNPLKLIEELCSAQTSFVRLICDNPILQDMIIDKAMKYYDEE